MKQISQKHIEEMIQHAREHDPNECCGILAGQAESVTHLYKVRNSTPSPFRYVMDTNEQLAVMNDADEKGLDLMYFYHSHTHSPAFPSDTDIRMAVESGWVDFGYVLVGLEEKDVPEVNFFVIDSEGLVICEEYAIVYVYRCEGCKKIESFRGTITKTLPLKQYCASTRGLENLTYDV